MFQLSLQALFSRFVTVDPNIQLNTLGYTKKLNV